MNKSRWSSWMSSIARFGKHRRNSTERKRSLFLKSRNPRIEPLEQRQMLSITVDSWLDVVDPNDGVITLREAVYEANTLPGEDTIDFDASVFNQPRTITLGGTELEISDDLVIQGPDAALVTVDGDGLSRVFHVDSTAAADFSGLTITGGDAGISHGGAIFAHIASNLTITSCNFTDNVADFGGAVYAYATPLDIIDSTFTLNSAYTGGAVYASNSEANISGSTFEENHADGYGGGVFVGNDLNVTGCVFRNNTSDGSGGALGGDYDPFLNIDISHSIFEGNVADYGGAIVAMGAGWSYDSFTIDNSIFSGNLATSDGGAIYLWEIEAEITNVTIAGNEATQEGGGIACAGGSEVTAYNSIVSLNEAALDPEVSGLINAYHSLVGTDPLFASNPDPGLDGVWGTDDDDYGNLRLTQFSMDAINQGDNAQVNSATDLDGKDRIIFGTVDIGAYEDEGSLLVSTNVDESDGDYTYGDLSLREAIELANGHTGEDVITFDPSLSGQTVTLGGTQLSITEDVDIQGLGMANLTVDADGLSRVFSVANGVAAVFSGITITGGQTDWYGGGIYAGSNTSITLVDATVSGNALWTDEEDAWVCGAGIYGGYNSVINITDSTISNNEAESHGWWGYAMGGGIYGSSYSQITITDSIVSGNSVTTFEDETQTSGGGIYGGVHSVITVNNSTITNNLAESNGYYGCAYGGGIYTSSYSEISVTDSTLSSNLVASDGEESYIVGGAIYHGSYGVVTIEDSMISGNVAVNYGYCGSAMVGGIYSGGYSQISLTDSSVSSNLALATAEDGSAFAGGIQTGSLSELVVTGSTISGNVATSLDSGSGYAGGIYASRTTITLTNSTVADNLADAYAGGIYGYYYTTLNVTGSTISGNSAGSSAGGIYATQYTTVNITDSTVSQNSASSYGGGIYASYSTVDVTDSHFSGNTAGSHGGGIDGHRSTITVTNSALVGNQAETQGGAIYGGTESEIALTNTTVAANVAGVAGGGVYATNILNAYNTIFSLNDAPANPDVYGTLGGNNNLVGTDPLFVTDPDPGLDGVWGTADDNYGDLNLTAASPAVNAGDNTAAAGINYDLDDKARIIYGTVDIGAYEYEGALLVSTNIDESDGDYTYGDLSLREAIELANGHTGEDVITFDPSLSGQTVMLGGTQLSITDNVDIQGLGATNLTVDADGLSRVFYVASGVDASFSGLTVTGGQNDWAGAGIYASSNNEISLFDVTLTGNMLWSDYEDYETCGAGFYAGSNCVVDIVDSTISDNSAEMTGWWGYSYGGGIYAGSYSLFTITNSTVSDNAAIANGEDVEVSGGGIFVGYYAQLVMTDSTVSGNSAEANEMYNYAHGGGIFGAAYSQVALIDSTVSNNSAIAAGEDAEASGGGICAGTLGQLTVTGSTLSGNSALYTSEWGYAYAGAIYAYRSTINLSDSTVSDNFADGSAGGIYVYYQTTLNITDSTISGNSADGYAGGIFATNQNTLNITDSTISNNSASASGGGIYVTYLTTLDVTGSTISGNSAGAYGYGGGVYTHRSTTNITDSILSGNTANYGGAIRSYYTGDTVTVTNSALVGNYASTQGGAVYGHTDTTVTLINATVAGNEAGSEGGGVSALGALDAYNTIISLNDAPTNPDVSGTLGGNHNLVGTNPLFETDPDPGLDGVWGTADDDYGDLNLTAASPAVNAGDNTAAAGIDYDLEGKNRIIFDIVDIGAYEYEGTLLVSTNVDESDGDYTYGDLSLREAIELANGHTGEDVITFDPSLSGQTITLGGTQLAINGNVDIQGLGAANLTVDANGLSRVFYIASGVTADFTGLTITGGLVDSHGGGIDAGNNCTVTLTNSVVSGNSVITYDEDGGVYGGGVYIGNSGTVNVVGSTISDNSAEIYGWWGYAYGGGIYGSSYSHISITGSTVSDNLVIGDEEDTYVVGGAIYSGSYGAITIDDSTISGNWVQNDGYWGSATAGGIFGSTSNQITVTNSVISSNLVIANGEESSASAGGIYAGYQAQLAITESTISGNTAVSQGLWGFASGGGIYLSNRGQVSITDSAVSGNSVLATDEEGYASTGGIYAGYETQLTITESTVSGNIATSMGTYASAAVGGIYAYHGTVTLTNSTVADNISDSYAGGIYASYETLNITDSTISGNSAGSYAGGIYSYRSTTNITDSILSGNTANYGGAIRSYYNDTVTVTNSALVGNQANSQGGAIYGYSNSTVTLTNTTIAGNKAGSNGGGVYTTSVLNAYNTIFSLNDAPTNPNVSGTLGGDHNLVGVDPLFVADPDPGLDGVWGTADDDYGDLNLTTGSPAFNMGDNTAAAGIDFDLEGKDRIIYGTVDIGAYEYDGGLIVSTNVDESDGDYSFGDLSLREALELAETHPGEDVITFDPALSGQTITLGGTELEINDDVVIQGLGAANLTIDGDGLSRVFHVAFGVEATFSGLTITGGDAGTGDGGGIYAEIASVLTVASCDFTGNTGDFGGAIYAYAVPVDITNSNFTLNEAVTGGAVYSANSVTNISGSTFEENASLNYGYGGAVFVGNELNVTDCVFRNNTSQGSGGAIGGEYDPYLNIDISHSIFEGNVASSGGAIVVMGHGLGYDLLTIDNSVFSGNLATSGGGAIFLWGMNAELVNTTIAGNEAGQDGGGIDGHQSTSVTAYNTIIALNEAPTDPDVAVTLYGDHNLIGVDPQFVSDPDPGLDGTWGTADDDYGNLRLTQFSTDAINQGDNAQVNSATDLDGKDRIIFGTVDIGAYEYDGVSLIEMTLDGPGSIGEGSEFILTLGPVTGTSDPIGGYTIHWGDDSDPEVYSETELNAQGRQVSHFYPDGPSAPVITVDVIIDGNPYTPLASTNSTVTNVAPALTLAPETSSFSTRQEPFTIENLGTIMDPGFGGSETFNYAIDWDYDGAFTVDQSGEIDVTDGSPGVPTTGVFDGTWFYPNVGQYTVAVWISDGMGEDIEYFQVNVVNNPPVVNLSGDLVGDLYTLDLDIQDPDGDDIIETFINWGDGSDPDGDGFIGEVVTGAPTQLTHTYTQPGAFAIQVQAKDEYGAIGFGQIFVNVDGTVYSTLPEVHGLQLSQQFGGFSTDVPVITGHVVDYDDPVEFMPVEFDVTGDGLAEGVVYADGDGSGEFVADLSSFLHEAGSYTARFRGAEQGEDGELIYGEWASITFTYDGPAGGDPYVSDPHQSPGNGEADLLDYYPVTDPDVVGPEGVNPVQYTGGDISGGTYGEFAYSGTRWDPTYGYTWDYVYDPDPDEYVYSYGGLTRITVTDTAREQHSTWVSSTEWSYTSTYTYEQTVTTTYVSADTNWTRTQTEYYTYSFIASRDGDDVDYLMEESGTNTLDYDWHYDSIVTGHTIDDNLAVDWIRSFTRVDEGHRTYLTGSDFTSTETTDYDATSDYLSQTDYIENHVETGNDWHNEWHETHEIDWTYAIDNEYDVAVDGSWTNDHEFDYALDDDRAFTEIRDLYSVTTTGGWWNVNRTTTLDKSTLFEGTTLIDYDFEGTTTSGSGIDTESISDYTYVDNTDDHYVIDSTETVVTDDSGEYDDVAITATSVCNSDLDRVRQFDEARGGHYEVDGGEWDFHGATVGDNRTTSTWARSYSNVVDGTDNSNPDITRTVHTTQNGNSSGVDTYRMLSTGTHDSDWLGFSQYIGTTDVWKTADGVSDWNNTAVSDADGTIETWSFPDDITTTDFTAHGDWSAQGNGMYTAQSYGHEERLADGQQFRWGNSSHNASVQGVSDGASYYDATVTSVRHPSSNVTETSVVHTTTNGSTDGSYNGSSVGSASYNNTDWTSSETVTYHQEGTEQSSLVQDTTANRVDTNTYGLIVNSDFTSHYTEDSEGEFSGDYTSQTDDVSGAVTVEVTMSSVGDGTSSTSKTYSGHSNTVDKTVSNVTATTDTTFSGTEATEGEYDTTSDSWSLRHPSGASDHTSSSTYDENGTSDTTSLSTVVYSLDDQSTSLHRTVDSTADSSFVGSGEYAFSRATEESGDVNGNIFAQIQEDRQSSDVGDTIYSLISESTVNGTEQPVYGVSRTIDSTENYTEDRTGHGTKNAEYHSLSTNYNTSVVYNSARHEESSDTGTVEWTRALDSTTDVVDTSVWDVLRTDHVEVLDNSNGSGEYDSSYLFDKVIANEDWSSLTEHLDDGISESSFNRIVDSQSHYENLADDYFERYGDSTSHLVESGNETVLTHEESSDARLLDGTVTSYSLREETVDASGDSDSTIHEETLVDYFRATYFGTNWTITESVTDGVADRHNATSFVENSSYSRESVNGDTTVQDDSVRTEEGTFDGTGSSDTVGSSYSSTSTKYEESVFTAYEDSFFDGEFNALYEYEEVVNPQGQSALTNNTQYSETGTIERSNGSTNNGYNEVTKAGYSEEEYLATSTSDTTSSGTTITDYTTSEDSFYSRQFNKTFVSDYEKEYEENGTSTWDSTTSAQGHTDDNTDPDWTITSDFSTFVENGGITDFDRTELNGYHHSSTSNSDWSESTNAEDSTYSWTRVESGTNVKEGGWFDWDLYFWTGGYYSDGVDETHTSSFISTEDGSGTSTLDEFNSTVDNDTTWWKDFTANDSTDYTLTETNTTEVYVDYPIDSSTSDFDGQGYTDSDSSSTITTIGTSTYSEDSSETHYPDWTWMEDDTIVDTNVGTTTTHLESHSTGHEDGVGEQGSAITRDTQFDRTEDKVDNFDIFKEVHSVHDLDGYTTETVDAITAEDGTYSWTETIVEDTSAVQDENSFSWSHKDSTDTGSGDYISDSDVTTITGSEYDKFGYADYSGSVEGSLAENTTEGWEITAGPYVNGNVTRHTISSYEKTDGSSCQYSADRVKNITYVDPWTTVYDGGSSGVVDSTGGGSETKALTYVTTTETFGPDYYECVEESDTRSSTDTTVTGGHVTYSTELDQFGNEGNPVEDVTTTETTTTTYTKTYEENGEYEGYAGGSTWHFIDIPGYGDPLDGLMVSTWQAFDETYRTWHDLEEESVTKGETITTHNWDSTRYVWREATTHTIDEWDQTGDNHYVDGDYESNEHYEDDWYLERTYTERREEDGSGHAHDVATFEYNRPEWSYDETSGSGETYYHYDWSSTDYRIADSEFYVVVFADETSLTTIDDYSHAYDETYDENWSNYYDSGWYTSTSYDDYAEWLVGTMMYWTSDTGGTSDSSWGDPSSWDYSDSGSYEVSVIGSYMLTVDGPETWSAFFTDVGNALEGEWFEIWNELVNFSTNPGAYTQDIITSTLDTLAEVATRSVDAFCGWVDGVIASINPFQEWIPLSIFGGSIFGHDGYYNGGYIAGIVTGVGLNILIGNVAGGMYACGSMLAKAAKLYTVIDTIAGFAAGAQHIAEGKAGIGDILAFAPALSWAGRKLAGLQDACFEEDTQVIVDVNEDGTYVTKSIQDIQVGDEVLTRDQNDPDAPLVRSEVVETFVHEVESLRIVAVQNASGNVETIVTTDEHPFWIDNIGWVEARDLETGSVVVTPDGGTAIVVSNTLQLLDAPVMVYNLEVAEGHTYFVEDGQGSQTPIWVHNVCKIKEGEIYPYGWFNRKPNVGDDLEGHEILQNAWLKHHGKTGVKGKNPALAVDVPSHKALSAEQAARGLHSPAVLKTMTRVKNIRENLNVLRQLGYAEDVIQDLRKQVLQYARSVGR